MGSNQASFSTALAYLGSLAALGAPSICARARLRKRAGVEAQGDALKMSWNIVTSTSTGTAPPPHVCFLHSGLAHLDYLTYLLPFALFSPKLGKPFPNALPTTSLDPYDHLPDVLLNGTDVPNSLLSLLPARSRGGLTGRKICLTGSKPTRPAG